MAVLIFENRLVCFLDILGFSEIVKNIVEVQRIIQIIDDVVTEAIPIDKQGIYPTSPIIKTALSDSIVLSIYLPNGKYEALKTLRYLLHVVETIQLRCALSDVWIRGGISWGELHHATNGGNVVGIALVKAYRLEQEAKYPRVILDPSLIPDFFVPLKGAGDREELIKDVNLTFNAPAYSGTFLYDESKNKGNGYQGFFLDDVPFFVNYFGTLYEKRITEAEREKIGEYIRKRIYSNYNPSIYSKYRWVVDYIKAITPIGSDLKKGLPSFIFSL